jgi:hypothetical protein
VAPGDAHRRGDATRALSAVAIGLAVYIQPLPDGSSVTVKALTLRFREEVDRPPRAQRA